VLCSCQPSGISAYACKTSSVHCIKYSSVYQVDGRVWFLDFCVTNLLRCFEMTFSALHAVSFSNSRRLIYSYKSPVTSQLRYLRNRVAPISVSNSRSVPLRHRGFLCSLERFTPRYSFVRWSSSSTASSGVQFANVSIFTAVNLSRGQHVTI